MHRKFVWFQVDPPVASWGDAYFDLVSRYLGRKGCSVDKICWSADEFREKYARQLIRDSNYVLFWHGESPEFEILRSICTEFGKKFVIVEAGFVPHSDHFYFDKQGITGRSSLCGPLDWVEKEDVENLRSFREEYLEKNDYSHIEGDYIVCPLQIESDPAIYKYSPYKKMSEFIDAVAARFPDTELVVTPHPFHPDFNIRRKKVVVERIKTTVEMAQNARMVIGLTSNVLYETALIGCRTVALGRCPMNSHLNEPETLLAGCLKVQILKTRELDPNDFQRVGIVV